MSRQPPPVESHFGYGILTWRIPYLFRTPPGYNLLVRGPANSPKDGVAALEGLVETDWAVATFTMNWKITRTGHPVRFEAGEAFCMIAPQRRGELEAFDPELRDIRSEPEVAETTKRWAEGRDRAQVRQFLARQSGGLRDQWFAWEGDYFRGAAPEGDLFAEHQKRLHLKPFRSSTDGEE